MSLVVYEVSRKDRTERWGVELFLDKSKAEEHVEYLTKWELRNDLRRFHKLSGIGPNSKDHAEAEEIQQRITEGIYKIVERRVST
tara:strand:+ start:419 stop:673 length:255 start_codon:yes stop_codon:yes gene_type:complete